jgi:hypothetical protein
LMIKLLIPDVRTKLPKTLIVTAPPPPCDIDPANPAVERLLQETLAITETTPPLFASKKTSSAEVGTLAPTAPPEVADQRCVLVVSQLPVPAPT